MLVGGQQCSTKAELMSVKRQLASLQSLVDYFLQLSSQYQLHNVSGRYLSHLSENILIY